MKETTNLKLKKPGYADPVDINVINKNMDAIDKAIAGKATKEELEALEGKIGEEGRAPYQLSFNPPESKDIFWLDLNEAPDTSDWIEIKEKAKKEGK